MHKGPTRFRKCNEKNANAFSDDKEGIELMVDQTIIVCEAQEKALFAMAVKVKTWPYSGISTSWQILYAVE